MMIKDFNFTYGTTHYKNGEDVKTLTVNGTYNDKAFTLVVSEEEMRANWKADKDIKMLFEDYIKKSVAEQFKKNKSI